MDFASRAGEPRSALKQDGSMAPRSARAAPAPVPAVGRAEARGPDRPGPGPGQDLESVVIPLVGVLTRASRRILHDEALADDAIQETLLAYWTRPERPENPRAWLVHAVTLRSLHLARSQRRRRDHERRACLGRAEGSRQDDPARSLDYGDLARALDESLGRVPADSRAVFVLWAFEEMEYAGIAEALRIPIGTVRSRLNRTRKAIRQSLAHDFAKPCPRCGALDPAANPGRPG